MTNKKRTANSAQAQPKKGMRLFANRYGQVYRMTSYILNNNNYIYKKVEISNHSKNGAKSEKPNE